MIEGDHRGKHIVPSLLQSSAWALIGCILLEAGTLFGSFSHSVRDFSSWMPKRMLVFFVILLPLSLLHSFRQKPTPHVVAKDRFLAALPIVARVAISLLLGFGAGLLLSFAFGHGGDIRYGFIAAFITNAIVLLALLYRTGYLDICLGFLVIAASFGTLICLLMPTAAEISWDGQIHFKKATALSYCFDAEYTGADRIMCEGGPEGALYLMDDLANIEEQPVELDSRTISIPHASLHAGDLEHARDILQHAENDEELVLLRGTETYPSGSYLSTNTVGLIPNACGLWFGRLLRLGCVERYTLARLFNMYAYILVFFFAIRSLRRGRSILAVFGLCPTAMLMAANFSYDPLHIALITLAVARYVHVLQDDAPVGSRETLGILVPFFVGALIKAVVFPLALSFIFVPPRRFCSQKNRIMHYFLTVACIALLVMSFALPLLTVTSAGATTGDARGGSQVSVSGQVSYVLSHPLKTANMSITFTLRMLNPLQLGFGFTPSEENLLHYFPYLIPTTAPLTRILAGLEFLLMMGISLFDGGEEDQRYHQPVYKIATLLTTGMSFAMICAALYASFTDVGRSVISGVQYRYLLPLVPLFVLIVLNTSLRRRGMPATSHVWLCATEVLLLSAVVFNAFVLQF